MFVNNQIAQKKAFLLLFFLCCSLPFVAAKLALQYSWFSSGVTNKGVWLEREIQLLPVSIYTKNKWHLVYVQGAECDASCEWALYTLQQLYSGAGAQQDRLSVSIIAYKAPEQLTRFPDLIWQSPLNPAIELQNKLLIANQEGIALLSYPVENNSAHILSTAKDIRSDLRRLMAYDRGSQ